MKHMDYIYFEEDYYKNKKEMFLTFDDACVFDNKIQDDEVKKYELSRTDCNQFLEV